MNKNYYVDFKMIIYPLFKHNEKLATATRNVYVEIIAFEKKLFLVFLLIKYIGGIKSTFYVRIQFK